VNEENLISLSGKDPTGAYVLAVLRDRVGAVNAITAADLAAKASAFEVRKIDGREIRDIIHGLRLAGHCICSSSVGFYWPSCLQDVLGCVNLEFRSEAKVMLRVSRIMRESGRRMFGGQASLL
jgi:hypothetical protein